MVNLGFDAARRVVQAGRGAFFPTPDADLPVRQSSILREDDQIPQLGFVGANYAAHRVLLLGINPGNGGDDQKRIPADEKMMPAMYAFAREPTEQNFVAASRAYQTGFETWGRDCFAVRIYSVPESLPPAMSPMPRACRGGQGASRRSLTA